MKSKNSETLIVVPAYNESETISNVIFSIKSALPNTDILVVNDASKDSTSQIVKELGVPILDLPVNLGVGGAMRLGFKYALKFGYANVVQIDADGQHHPSEVYKLVNELKNFDVVIGARFSGSGNYVVRGPRKWAMKLLSWALSIITKTKLTDTTSGFKANGPAAIELFSELYPAEYLGDTVESLVIASKNGLRITQVPVSMSERMGGTPSQNPLRSSLYLLRSVLALLTALLVPSRSKKEAKL